MHVSTAGPSATPLWTRHAVPTHHEIGIGNVVLNHTPAQDDHAGALGEDSLCIDEPQVWGGRLRSDCGPSQPSSPAPLWPQRLTLNNVQDQARVLIGMEEDHVPQ